MTITKAVEDWISDKEEPEYTRKQILEQLREHGCVCGMVGGLIYNSDCIKFLNKHLEEVEEIINEIGNDFGTYGFLTNKNGFSFPRLAWIAFEHRAWQMLNKMEQEE